MSQLEQRGIAESAKKLGWKANADGYWHYPVWDENGNVIATRAKAFPNTQQAKDKKYYWPDGKPNNPAADWYTPPGTLEAIEAANGVAYLANGEAALLAFHAAGIYNVIATCHGENTVPKNTDVTLQSFRIATLINIPDKDEAGVKAAAKWRDALLNSGIGYQAKQWPDYLPEKSDFNDLWVHVAFDAQAARKALNECQALILPQPAVKTPKPVMHLDFTEGRAKLVSALYEEMNRQSLLERKIFQGIWHQAHCPFHEDKNASAGFNVESGVLNCMGECGKPYSPKELAEKLGIDWKGFFQQEGRKSPKKAEIQAFQEALEEMPATTQSYEETMLEEMNLRVMIHEHHQYVGFGQWKAFPLGILSAVMTLCTGRSHTALFLARLHDALRRGELPTVFNREMVVKATRMPYNTVSKALFEAEGLSFLQKLSGLLFSIDSIPSKETAKNSEGRPCDWFIVELEAGEITSRLRYLMETYQLEHLPKNAFTIPTKRHASQLGLSEAEHRVWRDKAMLALEDPVNKAAKIAYDMEMLGNGGSWKGWIKALENKWSMPLPYFEYENSLDLRAGILNYWVTCLNRTTNSREELARLLGCSDPVIDKVLERAKLKSLPQTLKVELNFTTKSATLKREDEFKNEFIQTVKFQRPTTVTGMESTLNHFMGEYKGKVWKINFLISGEEGWQVSDMARYKKDFAKYNGRILRVFFLMNTPSMQLPLTAFDLQVIAEKQAKETAENGANQAVPVNVSEVQANDKPESEKEAQTHSSEYAKWEQHSYAYSYIQLRNFVHSYTMHELKGLKIVDKRGKELATGELVDLYRWTLANAAAKPTRRMKALAGDYEEENMQELEAFAAAQLKRLGLNEWLEYEDVPEETEDVKQLAIFSMFA